MQGHQHTAFQFNVEFSGLAKELVGGTPPSRIPLGRRASSIGTNRLLFNTTCVLELIAIINERRVEGGSHFVERRRDVRTRRRRLLSPLVASCYRYLIGIAAA